MDQLVEDYKNMPHGKDGEFFIAGDRGMSPFFIKYMHYCLFGINPFDTKKFTISRLLRKVVKIYEDSPSIQAFSENQPVFANMSRHEFAHSFVPIMAIAAMIGPRHLLWSTMGHKPIPISDEAKRDGVDVADVAAIWKTINLDDAKELDAFIYETGRLWCPVGHTHRVATEAFTVNMLGKDRTFPEGTIVSIAINMCMVNKNIWGQDAFEFNHKRANVEKGSMIFHSVGSKHGGRICPGKWFAMDMIREILIKCGKVHQAS